MILKQIELDDLQEGGGIDCHGMCFGIGKCKNQCEKITGAMANSTGFPCIAAGLCPKLDEFGEVSCKWSYKTMGCDPPSACQFKFPNQCELKPGFAKWKKVGKALTEQLDALGDGFRNRKRCSEEGAGPYCIRDAEGIGRLAEYGGLVMTFMGGVAFSVRAIETPGGDDDRQWLTFWMIFFFFTIAERYADVLLSQTPRYYETKFVLLCWLMFAEGADKLYRVVRSALKKLSRIIPIFPQRAQLTEAEFIRTLPKKLQRRATEEGCAKLFASWRCDADIAAQFDEGVLVQLWAMWNKVDPRYLSVRLRSASGLPAMDDNGKTDAYAMAYLVPPDPALPPSPLNAVDDELPEVPEVAETPKPAWVVPMPRNLSGSLLDMMMGPKTPPKPMMTEDEAAAKLQAIMRGQETRRALRGEGVSKSKWGVVRQARARRRVSRTLFALTHSASFALKALRKHDYRAALTRAYAAVVEWLLAKVGAGAMKRIGSFTAFSGGPEGPPGQYGGVRSRVSRRSLNPVWKNEWLELRLQGSVMSDDGEYDNPTAPYTGLRIEIWDNDRLNRDDFIGEVFVPLCPLMNGGTHTHTLPLTDPEGKSEAPNGAQGSITFEIQYES